MVNKIDRREFLCVMAKTGCGCAMAAGLVGCATFGTSGLQKESKLGAYCGLYCGACALYLSSVNAEDPSEVVCLGCKSDTLAEHCLDCAMKDCALEKNLSACGECPEFPCEKTQAFHSRDNDMSPVAEKSSYRIQQIGYLPWIKERVARWTCTSCGSIFSFRDETCPNCSEDVYSMSEEATDYKETRA